MQMPPSKCSHVRRRVQKLRGGLVIEGASCPVSLLISRHADDTANTNHAANSYALRSERLTYTKHQLSFENKMRFRRGRDLSLGRMHASNSYVQIRLWHTSLILTISWPHVDWNPYAGRRIGEAQNPGPGNQTHNFTCAILNPTVLTERQADILALNADAISLVETSATSTIQNEFSQWHHKRAQLMPFRIKFLDGEKH